MGPRKQVRKMRRPGQHHGRSTDGIRDIGHDQDIVAAKRQAGTLSQLISQPENRVTS